MTSFGEVSRQVSLSVIFEGVSSSCLSADRGVLSWCNSFLCFFFFFSELFEFRLCNIFGCSEVNFVNLETMLGLNSLSRVSSVLDSLAHLEV